MTVTAVVGAQWGDEGKGRMVDYLARAADVVIRYQGGDNAGHRVVNDRGTFSLHVIPSGIFHSGTVCVVGTGMVVHPEALLREMDLLEQAGISLETLVLSERAHVILPFHRLLDGIEETSRGAQRIGTTKRGIGPAYADKAARHGLRLGDLRHPERAAMALRRAVGRANRVLVSHGEPPFDADRLVDQVTEWGARLAPRIVDTLPLVRDAVLSGKQVLLEGQLGVMRDLDWGTYPFVTSSTPLTGGACSGAGLPPRAIDRVVGVVKAYSTAVGAGPFPVELHGEDGDRLRELGSEYGTTTGRPRRCGWLDGVALRYATWLDGITELAVTKLDVLDSLPEIRLCIGYRIGDSVLTEMPDTPTLAEVEPLYDTVPGWQQSTREVTQWRELPAAARSYLRRIAKLAGARIGYVSVGAERDRIIEVGSEQEAA